LTRLIDSTGTAGAALTPGWAEEYFGEVLRNVHLATVMYDCAGRISFCNDHLLALTGWQLEEVMGQNVFEIFIPFDRNSPLHLATRPDAINATWSQESEIFTRSGECRLIRWNCLQIRSSTGYVIGLAAIGEDITDRRQAEARIAYLNRIYSVLSGINSLIVRVRDRAELFKEACRVATTQGEFPLAMMGTIDHCAMRIATVAVEGKDPWVVTAIKATLSMSDGSINSMVAEALTTKLPAVANDSQNDTRVAFREKHAELGCGSMVILPLIVAGKVTCVLALYAKEKHFFHEEEMKLLKELASDIGFAIDHIEAQERYEYLAYYDAITGLANRNLFLDRLAQHMRGAATSGEQVGLLLIDVERFKNINDTLGEPAGDELLRQVADWLRQNTGNADLLTRFSADHFAVVLPNAWHE
jgi:PAS domain S-box-containing protein